MDRLNYFNPYVSKRPWHEDQLTRAFLVSVRLVPLALCVLLDLIREEQNIRRVDATIPSTTEFLSLDLEVETQKTTVSQVTGRLVSVVMTDETWTPERDVVESERGARYDGVLSFDPTWVIVIENKPSSKNIWEEQICPSLPDGHELVIDKTAIVLRWRDVIRRLTGLISSSILQGVERTIIDDFLQFVDDQFPYLNPYETFGHCKTSPPLLERRCRAVLESVAPGQVHWQPKWGTNYILLSQPSPVKMCGLYPKASGGDTVDQIELALYPGDSVSQARALFAHLNNHGVENLLRLREHGWKVRPNFHFGHIQTGFGHVKSPLSLENYIAYWMRHPVQQEKLAGRTFRDLLPEFVDAGMIDGSDVEQVVSDVTPNASAVNVVPGLEMLFDWPLPLAVELDRRGAMVEQVRSKADEGLWACGAERL